ncbi:MAG: hypothetical protein Q9217_005169 [Psora testacea]
MNPRDAPIAEAAAKAGFDCSDWRRLEGLINAVRDAILLTNHPDRYTGAAVFQSSLYPDKWRPNGTRQRKGVKKIYQDPDRATSVPARATTTVQIFKDVDDHAQGRRDSSTPTVLGYNAIKATASTSRLPLAPRSGNERAPATFHHHPEATGRSSTKKRTADAYVEPTCSSPKRIKTEQPAEPRHGKRNQIQIMNLQIASPVQLRPPIRQRIMKADGDAGGKARPRKGGRGPCRPVPQSIIRHDTTSILTRCASKLRAASHGIGMDRDSLRERWEMDVGLQLQHVTDDLAHLNARFSDAKRVIASAIAIVEDRLLHR